MTPQDELATLAALIHDLRKHKKLRWVYRGMIVVGMSYVIAHNQRVGK